MKKLILLTAIIGFSTLVKAQSQDFNAFKFDIGVGYALPTYGSGTQAGATFTLQPHYRLSDDFALGLRLEAALIGYKNSTTGNTKISALVSPCITGEYYLSDQSFRPFVGAGVGLFDEESFQGNTNNNGYGSGASLSGRSTNFGVFPEIGFELGHLRVSVDYNITGHNNDYVAFKIGAFFGGGRKKK